MTIPLMGQRIVVTGGAKRLGRAIALACAGAGADVVISYNRSQDEAHSAMDEMRVLRPQGRFEAHRADLTQMSQLNAFVDAALQGGRVDALVNNAAIFRRTPWADVTEADFDDHIAANLKAPFFLCRRFGDAFLTQGSGTIVNIADIWGLRPLSNYAPYCVSKAGLVMLTELLALALAPTVRVNALCPGAILPSGEDEAQDLARRVPLGRTGTPEEIAQAALFLLGGPSFLSGAVLPLDGAQRLR